jgi:uncharacterized membrane protein
VRNLSHDLILVILLAGIALLFPIPYPYSIPIGLLFVLYLPGYALTAAVFANKNHDLLERTLYSLGLSLATTVVAGLFLHLTRLKILAEHLSILLGGVTLLASVAALRLRNQNKNTSPSSKLKIDFSDGLLLAFSVLVLTLSLGVTQTPTPPEGFDGYTLLWVGEGETGSGTYQIGVQSHEFSNMGYNLRITAGGVELAFVPAFQLEPGQTLVMIDMLPGWITPQISLEAHLYRLDRPDELYRQVVFWPDG